MTGGSAAGDLVSVVIPTYYRNDVLSEAIESASGQTHENVEVIVVDDSGTANARPVAEEYDVEYVAFEENRGAHVAWEEGIRRANGRFVQLLDDDDVLWEEKFAEQLPVFSEEVGVVYAGYRRMGTDEVHCPAGDVRGDILPVALEMDAWPLNTATMLVKRELLESILPLRSRHYAADAGMRIQLAKRTHFDFVDEPLVDIRDSGPESMGSSMAHIEGRKRVLTEFEDLYERSPYERRMALRNTYIYEAEKHLESSRWSLPAIVAFAKAAYHDPDARALSLGRFACSSGVRDCASASDSGNG